MSEKKASVPRRYRNFATIVYPESAPADWMEVLSGYHVPAFVSPLHDSDKQADGTKKKPHYHVMLMYEGVKTFDQIYEVVSSIGGVGIETIGSIVGYSRYLCHMDEEDKVKYDPELVRCIAGADYFQVTQLPLDRHKCLREMRQFCRDNMITSIATFMDYCDEHRPAWSRLMNDNSAYVMDRYIKGISYEVENKKTVRKGS